MIKIDIKLEQAVKVIVSYTLDETIIDILTSRNYKKPMIVIDSFLLTTPIITRLLKALEKQKIRYYVYDKITPDPPAEIVNTGAKDCLDHQCDCIIAIGGGSSIDAARGINIVRLHGGEITEYAFDKNVSERCLGLIAVPTTSGTGSELSNALIVTANNEKVAILADNAVSEFAVLAPELVVTLPKNMTIATGLDTFSHAAEAYTSKLASPVVDAICEKVMYLVYKYLPKAVANGNDIEARERMMVAAALGGWLLNNGGTHIGHSQAHIIGSKFKIPHGMACAYALPGTLEYTATVKRKKVKEIGYILGASFPEDATDLEIGRITANAFKRFRDETLGLPAFQTLGIPRDEILTLATAVVTERFAGNTPFTVDERSVLLLLEQFGEGGV